MSQINDLVLRPKNLLTTTLILLAFQNEFYLIKYNTKNCADELKDVKKIFELITSDAIKKY